MLTMNYRDRIQRVAQALERESADLLFITPGADLRYLTGYDALPLERLTCLAIAADGQSWMTVPQLERPAAEAHDVEHLGIELMSWREVEDPYAKLIASTGRPRNVLINNLMWAEKAFGLRDALGHEVHLANRVLSDIRAVKGSDEVVALELAGTAIDAVHSRMSEWLRPGRTEREVGRDIAEAILAAGHQSVDFVIVGSGPNGASPHHELSDRVINANEPVVVDIGGTMPSGYCSDSTRMYSCGIPDSEYLEMYEVLKTAQEAAVTFARSGVSCESVDSVARDVLASAGLGDLFIHRTGHGIGLETHEEPYIVQGNKTLLQNGHAFSIEPGFYVAGKYGARIEDIVICRSDDVLNVNNTTHDLVIL